MEKITSKNKNNGGSSRRSKSGKKVHEESEEKVVHYFHYDNYSKKVVKKGSNHPKPSKETAINNKAKVMRDKRSPDTLLSTELKRVKTFSQSAKNLHNIEPKGLKKHKSP